MTKNEKGGRGMGLQPTPHLGRIGEGREGGGVHPLKVAKLRLQLGKSNGACFVSGYAPTKIWNSTAKRQF